MVQKFNVNNIQNDFTTNPSKMELQIKSSKSNIFVFFYEIAKSFFLLKNGLFGFFMKLQNYFFHSCLEPHRILCDASKLRHDTRRIATVCGLRRELRGVRASCTDARVTSMSSSRVHYRCRYFEIVDCRRERLDDGASR